MIAAEAMPKVIRLTVMWLSISLTSEMAGRAAIGRPAARTRLTNRLRRLFHCRPQGRPADRRPVVFKALASGLRGAALRTFARGFLRLRLLLSAPSPVALHHFLDGVAGMVDDDPAHRGSDRSGHAGARHLAGRRHGGAAGVVGQGLAFPLLAGLSGGADARFRRRLLLLLLRRRGLGRRLLRLRLVLGESRCGHGYGGPAQAKGDLHRASPSRAEARGSRAPGCDAVSNLSRLRFRRCSRFTTKREGGASIGAVPDTKRARHVPPG